MSKITASPKLAQVQQDEHQRFADIFASDVVDKVNGKLDFQNNFNCKLVTITFTAPGVESSVDHGLGRVPSGYIVYGQSTAMSIHNGTSTNTATTLYLISNAAGTANLVVF